jgi:hypothetical protein
MLRWLPFSATALVAFSWSMFRVISGAWLSDDATISFRYARNLVEGLGLVYNAGERVEGYTNFLWTMLLAGGMSLGVAPESLAHALSSASWLTTLLLLASWSALLQRERPWPLPPMAAIALALHPHGRLFATSGLETALFDLLLTATVGLAMAAPPERWWRVQALGVGLLGALAMMTRPEGGLVLILGLLALGRSSGLALLPAAALLGPWLGFKLLYYGDLLPNTWYAKGAGSQWAQGLIYLRLYFGTYGLVALGLPAAAALAWTERSAGPPFPGARRWLLVVLPVLWCAYVARVGGDFMYARFLLPITPLLLLALEWGLLRLPVPTAGAVALGLAVAAGTRWAPIPPELRELPGLHGIVEERRWYPPEEVEDARRQGAVIAEKFEGIEYSAVFFGTQAMLMYYGRVPHALEGHAGLTDREIARLPDRGEARVGHAKTVGLSYLQGRGVDIQFGYRVARDRPYYSRFELGPDLGGSFLRYRPELWEAMAARGVRVPDYLAELDEVLAGLDELGDERASELYAEHRGFYFNHTADPEREALFLARLGLTTPPRP